MRPLGKSGGGTLDVRLQNLADNLPGGMVFQMSAEGDQRRFLYVSKGVEKLFGVTVGDAIADAAVLYGRIDPAFLPALQAAEERSLDSGEPFLVETRLMPGLNGVRWVQISSARRIGPSGEEVWDGVVLDMTERKRAQEARDEAENRLEIATEASATGIWYWDLLSGQLEYSERAKAIYGFTAAEDITYEKLRTRTLSEDLGKANPALARALDPAQRTSEVYTYRIRRADNGEIRWLQAHGRATFAVHDGVDRAVSYVGTLQDITVQKNAELQLLESEARLRLAISAGQMAVWELDIRTDQITPSAELNQLYGFEPDATPTRDEMRARAAPGENERTQAQAQEMLARGENQIQVETKIIWPDGTPRWLAVRAQIINDENGVPLRAIGVAMDITARHQLEDRLTLVARELQHRVKNSLAVVQTIASQTFRAPRPYPEALEAYSGRLQALAAGTDIVTREDWSDAGIREVVDRVTAPYRGAYDDPFDIGGADVTIPSKVALGLSMALYELCSNAVKYGSLSTTPGGRVRVHWHAQDDWLHMTWTETGGPPVASSPAAGFGTKLLRKGIFEGSSGEVDLDYRREGLVCKMKARL